MNNFEKFKLYAKEHEELKKLVLDKKYTWQQLYELYDIYGENSKEFSDLLEKEEKTSEKKEEKTEDKKEEKGINNFLDLVAGFDAEKISEGLNGMKKILSVIGEITKPEENEIISKRKITRPYQRNDD